MVRTYKRKTDRAEINVVSLKKAVQEVVKNGRKIRDAALLYGITKTTLHRRVKNAFETLLATKGVGK